MKYLYFFGENCSPCKTLSPVIDSLISKGINITKINTNTQPEAVTKYGVRSVPTVMLLDDGGNVRKRIVGVMSEQYYLSNYKLN